MRKINWGWQWGITTLLLCVIAGGLIYDDNKKCDQILFLYKELGKERLKEAESSERYDSLFNSQNPWGIGEGQAGSGDVFIFRDSITGELKIDTTKNIKNVLH